MTPTHPTQTHRTASPCVRAIDPLLLVAPSFMIGVISLAIMTLLLPMSLGAQTVRALVLVQGVGTAPIVVTPASGVRAMPQVAAYLVLTDADGREVSRVIADTTGFTAITAPTSGQYRINVERIGYRSSPFTAFDLNADQILDVPLPWPDQRVTLANSELGGLECIDFENRAVDLWNEARKTLTAASWSDGRTFRYTSHLYEVVADSSGSVISERTRNGYGKPRFPSDGPRPAYVVESRRGSISYYAPTPGVLFAPDFTTSNCFTLAADQSRDLIGLSFHPKHDTTLSQFTGTLWFGRQTLTLQSLEYTLTDDVGDDVGGRIELDSVAPAEWIVRRWHVRVPWRRLRKGLVVRAGYRELGGEITSARRVADSAEPALGVSEDDRPLVWQAVTDESSIVRLAHRLSFGLKGGLGRTSISGDDIQVGERSTFHGGVFLSWAPVREFELQLEGVYARRGAEDGGGRIEVDYADVPVLVVFQPVTFSGLRISPHVFAGPTLSHRLRCRVHDVPSAAVTDCRDDTASISFAVTLGAGVRFRVGPRSFFVDATYVRGLSNANRDIDSAFDFKTRSMSLSFGLSFPFARGL